MTLEYSVDVITLKNYIQYNLAFKITTKITYKIIQHLKSQPTLHKKITNAYNHNQNYIENTSVIEITIVKCQEITGIGISFRSISPRYVYMGSWSSQSKLGCLPQVLR